MLHVGSIIEDEQEERSTLSDFSKFTISCVCVFFSDLDHAIMAHRPHPRCIELQVETIICFNLRQNTLSVFLVIKTITLMLASCHILNVDSTLLIKLCAKKAILISFFF